MHPLLEFFLLLSVITGAAWLLSYGAEIYAERFGANFAGSILLGLITTLPEYMFVIWASIKHEYAMAVGSAVGACSILVTLGYGSVILLSTTISRKPVRVIELSRNTEIDALYLLVTALVAFILAWEGGSFDLKDALILIGIFFVYTAHLSHVAYKFSKSRSEERGEGSRAKFVKGSIALGAGTVIVYFLTEPLVDSMIEVAHLFHISPVTIAVVLGPLASEMPEKLTAYITVFRNAKLAEISICNFIGSKVNHNSLLLGTMPLIAWLQGKGPVENILSFPFILMTLLTVFATLSLSRRKLNRLQGVFFTLLYGLVVWTAFKKI